MILAAALLAVTLDAARQDASATLTPQEGVRLMRTVNTSENAIKSGSGAYATLTDVIAHRTFVRAADGQGYQAALTPLSGTGTAWFTDERGLIFVGQPLQ